MRFSSTYLLLQGSESYMPAAAVVAQLKTGNWLRETPIEVVTKILSEPEVLEQCLPYLTPSSLGGLMPTLPNECRATVLKHSTRAAVMNGLSRTAGMSADVFDVFVEKGNMVALRAFLCEFAQAHTPSNYSAQQLLRVWLRLLQKFGEVPSLIPFSWTSSELSTAFAAVTDLLPRLASHGTMLAAPVWRAAEVAEVVTDTQRDAWYAEFEEPIGPRSYYEARGLACTRAALGRRGSSSGQERGLTELFVYGDVTSLLEMSSIVGSIEFPHNGHGPGFHRSPYLDELMPKCNEEALLSLLYAGVPLAKVVEHASSATAVFDLWVDNRQIAKTMSFPEEVVLELQPPVAVYVAKVHFGDFTLESLMAHLDENFGDSESAWQFFWDSYAIWSGSVKSLVETALAVS